MFWIPVCFVILLVATLSNVHQNVSPNSEKNRQERRAVVMDSFCRQVKDQELYRETLKKYKGNSALAYQTICDFAGVVPNPDNKYSLITHWEDFAVAADMSKKGKLPVHMVLGNQNCYTKEKCERIFLEQYFLRLEQELRSKGVNTFLTYYYHNASSPYNESYRLSDYIRRNGNGSTIDGGTIQWVDCTSDSLERDSMPWF